MSSNKGVFGARTGVRRMLRAERKQERQLVLRHRWYAGGVATLISAALIFTGTTSPAIADTATAPTPSTSDTATPPADVTDPAAPAADVTDPAADVTDPATPAADVTDPATPATDAPATDAPVTDETAPAVESEPEPSESASAPAQKSATSRIAPDAGIAPQSIVDPSPVAAGSTTLRVKKLGTRQSNGTVSTLAGATYYAVAGTRGGAQPDFGATSAYTCTTGSDGTCEIVLPTQSGGTGGSTAGYWVFEGAAPAGWNRITTIGTGDYDSAKTASKYMVFTGNVTGNSTIYQIPQDATAYANNANGTTTTKTALNGFANAVANPAFPASCGLSIAIVFDTSASINSTEMTQMKNAANSFVGTAGLGGTPSSVALYQFSTTASKRLASTSITAAGGQSTVTTSINALGNSGSGYTNWDDAMRKVAFNGAESYDVVLFLTDGDPTVSGTDGSSTELTIGFRNVEEGAFSANAVKSMTGPAGDKTKVVAVGIGLAANSFYNLRAISGPTADEDYYTTEFADLSAKLKSIATANCGGSLTVVKKTVDAAGNTIDAAAGGWTFTGSTSGSYIKTSGANVATLAATTPTTGSSKGAVNYPIDLTGAESRDVHVAETTQTGWTPDSVSCTGGTATGTAADFTVAVARNAIVSCTVTNKQIAATRLTLVKAFANTFGAPAVPGDWTLRANGSVFVHDVAQTVAPGDYTITEDSRAGYVVLQNSSITCTGGTFNATTGKVAVARSADVVCTLTNKDMPAKLQIVKQDMAGGQLAGATFQVWRESNGVSGLQTTASGQTPADTRVGGDVTAGSALVDNLAWGTYYVKETVAPAGYAVASPDTQTVAVGAAETATAKVVTFKNARLTGSLAITKQLVHPEGVVSGTIFSGTYSCSDANPTSAGTWSVIGAGSATLVPTSGLLQIPVGTTCTITETAPAGGLVDASWAWGAVAYTQPAAVESGKTSTGVVTNTATRVYGGITISKALAGTPDGFTGSYSGTWTCTYGTGPSAVPYGGGWSVSGAGVATLSGPATQIPLTSVCEVTETAPSDSLFAATPSYTWKSSVVSPASATVATADAQVAFAVTNTAQQATLRLDKQVVNTNGGTAVPTDWNQKLQAKSGSAAGILFDHAQTIPVTPGTYALSEIDQIAGYALTGIACTSSGADVPVTGDAVTVAAGAAVLCTLTNTAQKPVLTLEKQVDNTGGGISPATAWTLTAASGASTPINGTGTIVSTDVAAISAPVLGGTTYTLGENGPSGYTSTGVWSCVVTGTSTTVPVVGGDEVRTAVGQNVTCRIVNTAVPGTASVGKSAGTPVQNADGTWTIPYTITVTNTSAAATVTYSLTDTLSFGAGITPVSGTWTGPDGASGSFTGANATLATDVSLTKATLTHVYTVQVQATIAAGTDTGSTWMCSSTAPERAFLNTATMTVGAAQTTVEACAQPAFPVITKVGGTPQQNADAGWDVSYTITVNNPGAVAIQAALTDAFPSLPAGWTLTDGVWNIAAQSGAPIDSTTSAASPIWSGTLPANTTYAYVVSGTISPDSTAAPIGSCDTEGRGLINRATVTSGAIVKNATACVTITSPPVSVLKSDGTVQQLADLTWQIDYVVTVGNSSAEGTVYTLTDAPQLGTGFTLISGAWQGAQPAADTPIEAGGTHVYTYRVIASFDAQTPDPQLTCDPVTGGAFFNGATVVYPGGTASDTGCGQPASPTVTKTAAAATQGAGGVWSLSYTVTVTDPAGFPLAYSLTDTPAPLPAGVMLQTPWAVAGPAALDGGTFTAPDSAWDGGAQPQIGSGTLPPGKAHVFTVTAGVTLASGVVGADLLCGGDPASGTGVWNTVSVTNGVGGDTAEACTSITTPPVTIIKSDGTAAQAADGTWTIDYTVTVANSSASIATVYTLTDTPAFDSSFTILTQGWQGAQPTADAPIAGGASDLYHYVVTAIANKMPVDEAALVCSPSEHGGFFNAATVAFPGGSASDTGCAVPAKPVVQKTAEASVQNPTTGEWTLTYRIAVANPSAMALAYTLSDTAGALPSGVTGGAWSAGDPAVTGGGTFVRNADWAGAGELATGTLPAGAVHTYTATRTVTVDPSVPDSALMCGQTPNQGGGIWNTASVTNGLVVQDSSACAEITRAQVAIDKRVTGTSQLEDGSWQISYDVAVTNRSATLAAVYGLTDDLHFGGDILVEDASWSGPSPLSPGAFSLPAGSATLAVAQVLAAGATDTYTVIAHANIPPAAWTEDPSDLVCRTGQAPAAGGFLNTATVSANGATQTDSDCATPELPTVKKEGVSAVQDPQNPDQWTVSYRVTVTAGRYDTFYDLSDTPAFPDGITVIGQGAASLAPDGPLLDVTPGEDFVTGRAIAANTSDLYTVTWRVEVTDGFATDVGECTGEPGHGFFNTATLTVGEVPLDGTACIPVADRVYPTITKVVTSTTQKPADGDWVIEYDVAVSLAPTGEGNPRGLSASYSLSDTLDFGGDISIGNASWTGPTSGDFTGSGATFATDRTIAAGVTETYHVRVLAAVTVAAISAGTTACVAGPDPGAGGFLNTAQLRSGGQTTEADACSEPVFPEVYKSAVGEAVQDPETGLWSVTYDITVRYPSFERTGPKPSVAYDLTDAPTLPANVQLDGDWQASAANADTPAPTTPTWDGTGTWTIVDGGVLDPQKTGVTAHVFQVTAQVRVTAPPLGDPASCDGGQGIVVLNRATITSGAWEGDSTACQTVHYDDVGLVKTTDGVDGPVESGDAFDYVLTVTNHGTRPATDLKVTDPVPGRLTVTELDLTGAPGWVNDNLPLLVGAGNTVSFSAGSLGVGESAVFRIRVAVNPASVASVPNLGPDDPAPTAPALPESTLVNDACVAAATDDDPSDDCDSVTVDTNDIAAIVYTRCVADAPRLGFVLAKSANLTDLPVDFSWTPTAASPSTDPQSVQKSYAGGTTTVSDEFDWVGTAFTPSGVSIDYPGWRALRAADYAPGGGFYLPGTATVMTAQQQAQSVFNGLILDPSQLDYAWRATTTVTLSVNPGQTFEVAYPAPTPDCAVARHTEVRIDKSASVAKTDPGTSFTYSLDVANASDDAAADGVVVTDAIPADLRITDVSWTGEGDAATFPNWQACAVAGQSDAGYGGTLTCTLFGPLQPAGSELGASAAPAITLTAYVDPASKASVITNVAAVDYHTFGDPADAGRDTDDAVVLLAALPATGGSPMAPLLALGFLVILGGVTALVVARRRRGEARPRL